MFCSYFSNMERGSGTYSGQTHRSRLFWMCSFTFRRFSTPKNHRHKSGCNSEADQKGLVGGGSREVLRRRKMNFSLEVACFGEFGAFLNLEVEPRRHCVWWGPSSSQKGAHLPTFQPCLLWPNGWIDQDATLYGDRPWRSRHCIRWGPSSPKKRAQLSQFSAHVYCGETVGWIKMPLNWYGGRPQPRPNCVRWGPSSPKKGYSLPIFGPCLLWPNGRPSQLLFSTCCRIILQVMRLNPESVIWKSLKVAPLFSARYRVMSLWLIL